MELTPNISHQTPLEVRVNVGQRTARLPESLFKKLEYAPLNLGRNPEGGTPEPVVYKPSLRIIWFHRLVHHSCLSMDWAILRPWKERSLVIEELRVMQFFLVCRNASEFCPGEMHWVFRKDNSISVHCPIGY